MAKWLAKRSALRLKPYKNLNAQSCRLVDRHHKLYLAKVYNFSHRQAPTRYYLILQLDLLFDGEGLQSLWNELVNNGELSATADNITGIASGIKP